MDAPTHPCPICARPLETVRGKHGVFLACVDCQAGATTLPVLKKVAPREFVDHLWQMIQRHGEPSKRSCPSCARALLEAPAEVELEPRVDVCLPCYLVWLDATALAQAPVGERLPDRAPLGLPAPSRKDVLTPVDHRSAEDLAEAMLWVFDEWLD